VCRLYHSGRTRAQPQWVRGLPNVIGQWVAAGAKPSGATVDRTLFAPPVAVSGCARTGTRGRPPRKYEPGLHAAQGLRGKAPWRGLTDGGISHAKPHAARQRRFAAVIYFRLRYAEWRRRLAQFAADNPGQNSDVIAEEAHVHGAFGWRSLGVSSRCPRAAGPGRGGGWSALGFQALGTFLFCPGQGVPVVTHICRTADGDRKYPMSHDSGRM